MLICAAAEYVTYNPPKCGQINQPKIKNLTAARQIMCKYGLVPEDAGKFTQLGSSTTPTAPSGGYNP